MSADKTNVLNKMPTHLAEQILNLADAKGWGYAPIEEGCFSREAMDFYLNENKNEAFFLVIDNEDYNSDSVLITYSNGEFSAIIDDNFYHEYRNFKTLDQMELNVFELIKKSN